MSVFMNQLKRHITKSVNAGAIQYPELVIDYFIEHLVENNIHIHNMDETETSKLFQDYFKQHWQ